MRGALRNAAADQLLLLEVPEHVHECHPAQLVPISGKPCRHLAPAQVPTAAQPVDDQARQPLDPGLIEAVAPLELVGERATDPRRREVEKPRQIVRDDVVPGRPNDVGAEHPAVGERRAEIGGVWCSGA